MQKGDFAEACQRFADSMELDPALGTLLNMASCAERSGNNGRACEWFAAARDMARDKAQPDRGQFAESRLKALSCP
jgi:hypothetical protein